jgi:hypothetical protein
LLSRSSREEQIVELLFEAQLAVTAVEGKAYFFQAEPEIEPEPVFTPGARADGNWVMAHTVLHDGGRFRMWYAAFPEVDKPDLYRYVAYAESDDGLSWRRPTQNLLPDVPFENNYCDLGLNSPSVFVDPLAPASHRYRATGYRRGHEPSANPRGEGGGFFTAHSADGLHWTLDAPTARWLSGDVINSAYHPAQQRGICAMKFVRPYGGINRRAIWTADLRDGAWGDPVCALVPDDFDDVAAIARGHNSSDYYGMAMMPAGSGTVGFLWNFRHKLPLSMKPDHYAVFGTADVSLVFQAAPGDRWLHVPGRPSFMQCGPQSWNAGWIRTATCPVAVGDEHWLYFTGDGHDHAWDKGVDWQRLPEWRQVRESSGPHAVVGLAKWPKWRLFGFHADPEGVVEIELGEIAKPCELRLNYEAGVQGRIHTQLFAREGRLDRQDISGRSDPDASIPLTGDSLSETVRWQDGPVIHPIPGKRLVARLAMANARVYAWETVSVS